LSGSLAAGVFEAIIAAIYIDGGYDAAADFIVNSLGSLIDRADAEHSQGNFKSVLQQYAQEQFGTTPVYVLLDEKGPDHDKCFELEAVLEERHFPRRAAFSQRLGHEQERGRAKSRFQRTRGTRYA